MWAGILGGRVGRPGRWELYMCVYLSFNVNTYQGLCIQAYINIHIDTDTDTRVCIYIYVYIYICIYIVIIYIVIYIVIYIYMCIHTCTPIIPAFLS